MASTNNQAVSRSPSKKLNLPNTLSLLRVVMVPFFMASVIYMDTTGTGTAGVLGRVIPAIIFALTGLTDMLDGKIARKYGLVTDFGKFIDPLADKFMVFGALVAILTAYRYLAEPFVWVSAIVMLRELAITSLRLVVAGKSGHVIAASWWGKVKTTTQIISIILIIMEPVVFGTLYNVPETPFVGWFAMAAIVVTTVGSGIDYIRAYWQDLDPNR